MFIVLYTDFDSSESAGFVVVSGLYALGVRMLEPWWCNEPYSL